MDTSREASEHEPLQHGPVPQSRQVGSPCRPEHRTRGGKKKKKGHGSKLVETPIPAVELPPPRSRFTPPQAGSESFLLHLHRCPAQSQSSPQRKLRVCWCGTRSQDLGRGFLGYHPAYIVPARRRPGAFVDERDQALATRRRSEGPSPFVPCRSSYCLCPNTNLTYLPR